MPGATAAVLLVGGFTCMGFFKKPSPSKGLPAEDAELRARLEKTVRTLAEKIGERNMGRPDALEAAALFVEAELAKAAHEVHRQELTVCGRKVRNVEIVIEGAKLPDEHVVVGAHYDSVIGTPGADDNATGVAAMLELAQLLSKRRYERTLHFVGFVNEEPPYFQSGDMGSAHYARALKARGARVHAMLSLETIGYFSDAKSSQSYPFGLGLVYPTTGNFMGIVGNRPSAELVDTVAAAFRDARRVPYEKAALPTGIAGVGWSDQWSFWQEGYVGAMITDTAPFRNPHYHSPSDLPDTLDFERLPTPCARSSWP